MVLPTCGFARNTARVGPPGTHGGHRIRARPAWGNLTNRKNGHRSGRNHMVESRARHSTAARSQQVGGSRIRGSRRTVENPVPDSRLRPGKRDSGLELFRARGRYGWHFRARFDADGSSAHVGRGAHRRFGLRPPAAVASTPLVDPRYHGVSTAAEHL